MSVTKLLFKLELGCFIYLPQEGSILSVSVVLDDVLSSLQCCPRSSSAKQEVRHLGFSDSPRYRGKS